MGRKIGHFGEQKMKKMKKKIDTKAKRQKNADKKKV